MTSRVVLRRDMTRRDALHDCPTPGTWFQGSPLFLKTRRASTFFQLACTSDRWRSPKKTWPGVSPETPGRAPERDDCPCSHCQSSVRRGAAGAECLKHEACQVEGCVRVQQEGRALERGLGGRQSGDSTERKRGHDVAWIRVYDVDPCVRGSKSRDGGLGDAAELAESTRRFATVAIRTYTDPCIQNSIAMM